MNPPVVVDLDTLHPAAAIFPSPTEGPEFDALVEDIARNGLRESISRTLRGAIVDGRRRLAACRIAGVEPRFKIFTGDPWKYVIVTKIHRLNHRNHRAMVAAGAGLSPGCRLTGRQIMNLCDVSMGSYNRAKIITRTGIPGLQEETRAGRVPLTTGARVAQLDPRIQEQFLARFKATGIPARDLARPGWKGDKIVTGPVTRREARYRYVQKSALQLIGNSFDGLGIVLAAAEGLDPKMTSEQAAQWKADLSRRARSYRQLMALLHARSLTNEYQHHGEAG